MIVLLPADYHGLPELEQQFTPDNLKAWFQRLKSAGVQKTHVLIPRLKIAQSFDLSSTLTAMGMPSLFSETNSDLSGMGRTNDLFVSSVIHEATIEVNEEGTEAAAATAVHVRTKSQPPSFRADHPFIFLIIENRTGSILFLGRVVDPSKAQ
jgi:serpin B